MGIGISILIMAVGAILTFATNAKVNNFNLDNVGVIMMIAGAVSFVITLVLWGKGRTTTTVTQPSYSSPPAGPAVQTGTSDIVEERHTYRTAPPS